MEGGISTKAVFSSRLNWTPEQREQDEIHGIMENSEKRLTLKGDKFEFKSHYYYEYETGLYVLVDLII